MKRTAYFNPRAAARLVLAAACILLAAACTTDDDLSRPDKADDDPVPFTFTARRAAPMIAANTRAVPGKDAWKGDGTEKIGVHISLATEPTKFSKGTYTIISPDGETEVRSEDGDQFAFWPGKGDCKIVAWYLAPNTGETFDISDQSTPEKFRQADMVRASSPNNVAYGIEPNLQFMHYMAKVRVVLTGVNASATDIKVEILGVARFTLTDEGKIAPAAGQSESYITACRDTATPSIVAFEALIPGGAIVRQNFIRVTVGGKPYFFTPGASVYDDLPGGYTYAYRVTLPVTATATTASASHLVVSAPTVTPFNTSER